MPTVGMGRRQVVNADQIVLTDIEVGIELFDGVLQIVVADTAPGCPYRGLPGRHALWIAPTGQQVVHRQREVKVFMVSAGQRIHAGEAGDVYHCAGALVGVIAFAGAGNAQLAVEFFGGGVAYKQIAGDVAAVV